MSKNMTIEWKLPKRDSVGTAILAAFLVIVELAVLFAKPQIGFAGHQVYLSQGMAAYGMFLGALFWAIVEMFTKAGLGFWSLAARFSFAFILGGIFGGFLGYQTHFGTLVLIPASQGDGFAIFLLLSYFVLFGVIVYSAAWMHNRNFIKRGR